MVYFTGHSAINCRKFEYHVLTNPEVQSILKDKVVMVTLYCDDKASGKDNVMLQKQKFKSEGQPSIFFMTTDQKILTNSIGYSKADYFLEQLKKVVQ
jgi:thioredoxin-related protein